MSVGSHVKLPLTPQTKAMFSASLIKYTHKYRFGIQIHILLLTYTVCDVNISTYCKQRQ